jgi:hypothetical protein
MRGCVERQHLLAMAHGAVDAGQDVVVGQFEGVKELDDDGNVGETGVADSLDEGGDVVKATVVGPPPVGIALEVVVLQMKESDLVMTDDGIDEAGLRQLREAQVAFEVVGRESSVVS